MDHEAAGLQPPPELVLLQLRLRAAAGAFLRLMTLGHVLARAPGAVLDAGEAQLERLRQVVLELGRDGTVAVAGDQDQLVDVRARCGHDDWRRHTGAFLTTGQARPLRLLSAGAPAEDYSPGGINAESGEQLRQRVYVVGDLAVRLLSLVTLLPKESISTPNGRLRLLLFELAQELHDAAAGSVEEAEAVYWRQPTPDWPAQTQAFLISATARPAPTVPTLRPA